MNAFLQWLDALLTRWENEYYHRNDPVMPPEPTPIPVPVAAPKPTLVQFCTALRDYEGGPGDLNYQNNNPGNARCSSVGYLPKYGNVLCVETHSGKFAKFPTYELGWEYLQALVKEQVEKNPTWTILQFISHYSPTGDNNNPDLYAQFLAKRCGVDIAYKMINIINA